MCVRVLPTDRPAISNYMGQSALGLSQLSSETIFTLLKKAVEGRYVREDTELARSLLDLVRRTPDESVKEKREKHKGETEPPQGVYVLCVCVYVLPGVHAVCLARRWRGVFPDAFLTETSVRGEERST